MNKPMKPDPTFHASPKLAMQAPVENFAFTIMLGKDASQHDGLAVIDLRKDSQTYRLGDDGIAQFNALGIQTICDLRRPEEREQEPTPAAIRAERVEIPMDPGSAIAMRAALANEDLDAQARIDFMVAINHELAAKHQDDYALLFEALLHTEDGGFLVHCAAGKDRTGFAAALILHALGVDESMILSDYLFTNMAIDLEGHVLPRMRRHTNATVEVKTGPRIESTVASGSTGSRK